MPEIENKIWREVVLSSSRAGAGKREMRNPVLFCNTDRNPNKIQKTLHCDNWQREKGVRIIDKAVPMDHSINPKELEKIKKYEDLRTTAESMEH